MADKRPVFFFDIDNCLYPRSKYQRPHDMPLKNIGSKVGDYMIELINQYFMDRLALTREDACRLNQEYYKKYGLAVEGLVRHHKVNALEYNLKVDDSIPLESILSPDPKLQRLLEDFDKSKVKLWLFTNAYITHAKRVTRILGVDDVFEGVTFCDYGQKQIICKPHTEMYKKAMHEAGIANFNNCFFVGKGQCFRNRGHLTYSDDSEINCMKAEELGWVAIHLAEGDEYSASKPCRYQIKELEELRSLFPQFLVEKM